MTATQQDEFFARVLGFFADRPKLSPSEWCCEELQLNEPGNTGPFSLAGREYMREPIDAWGEPTTTDHVLIWGSQTGKTTSIMAGACWRLCHFSRRLFWVMPTQFLVNKFSGTRWQPMILATPVLEAMIPTGRARITQFKGLEQRVGTSIVDFSWAGSTTALSSTPAHDVILDEVDKFQEETEKETNSVNLAEQRTKNAADPKRVKTSTPTIPSGLIWQEFLKTDQRRRFVPCPGCGKFVVFAWSKTYTIFPVQGFEAFVQWDREAKRADGTWDLDRVERSARYVCPHCGFHIQDRHKTLMDRGGQWRPTATATAARGKKGWHLPSFYAPAVETNVGRIAIKFLEQCKSLEGPRGLINSEFAEPWMNQADVDTSVYEIVGPDSPELDDALPIMQVDCQLLAPFYWYVIRAWTKAGDSRLLAFGSANSEEELAALAQQHKVPDYAFGMDYKFNPQEVIKRCLNHGKTVPYGHGKLVWAGWKPMIGVRRSAIFKDSQGRPSFTKLAPMLPHAKMRVFDLPAVSFNGPVCKDFLDRLMKKKTGHKWELCPEVTDEYFRHLHSEYFDAEEMNGQDGGWLRRGKTPNHLKDCEVQQVAKALHLGRLKITSDALTKTKPEGPRPNEEEMSHAE